MRASVRTRRQACSHMRVSVRTDARERASMRAPLLSHHCASRKQALERECVAANRRVHERRRAVHHRAVHLQRDRPHTLAHMDALILAAHSPDSPWLFSAPIQRPVVSSPFPFLPSASKRALAAFACLALLLCPCVALC
eukprot:6205613-Pleurochrysis_carterae.AAC.2